MTAPPEPGGTRWSVGRPVYVMGNKRHRARIVERWGHLAKLDREVRGHDWWAAVDLTPPDPREGNR